MDDVVAIEGYEVVHRDHGRGCIVEPIAEGLPSSSYVEVLFYLTAKSVVVPIGSLSPAVEAASSTATAGTHGLSVQIDDGFFSISLETDGEGTGFDVQLRAGNAAIDSAHLDASSFLGR